MWRQRQVAWLFSPVEVPQFLFINSVEDTPAECFHSRIYPGLTLYGEEVSGICSEPPVNTTTRMYWYRQWCRQCQLK